MGDREELGSRRACTAPRAPVAPPWFAAVRASAGGVARVYCFPHAGGSAASFRPFAAAIHPDVEVWGASLPGRGPRHGEPPDGDWRRVVSSLADHVDRAGLPRFAFLGHSMGAMLGFELARELRRRGAPLPAALVVSGARAPHAFARPPHDHLHGLPQPAFIERLTRLGGIPQAVLSNPELLALVTPMLRSDIRMCETYQHAKEPPLPVRIVALRGSDDGAVPEDAVLAWREYTTQGCSVEVFPGAHFFIESHWAHVARVLESVLELSRPTGIG